MVSIDEYIESRVKSDYPFPDTVIDKAKRLIIRHFVEYQYTTSRYIVFKVYSETYKGHRYEVRIHYHIENKKMIFDIDKSSCECKGFTYYHYCKHICASLMTIYLYPYLITYKMI